MTERYTHDEQGNVYDYGIRIYGPDNAPLPSALKVIHRILDRRDTLAARCERLEAALAEGAILTRAEAGVLELKSQHAHTWRDKPEDYWLARLMAEVGELAGALVGDHDDEPEWELTQIAAICINWLELRAALGDPAADSGSRVRFE
jgi:hypothetical protein